MPTDNFAEQLAKIQALLRTKAVTHASGPKRPTLSDQEERTA